jgi:ribosomal protein S18 acetylase RimI-like enzyme
MKRSHIRACDEIVAASEPWKTLREKVDFGQTVTRRQAYACIRRTSGTSDVAGFIIFAAEPVFARGGYLRAIGVATSLRGQGIGSKLLAFAERAVSRQAAYFYLCVSSFNRKGQAFYKDRGYTRVGILPGLASPDSSEYIYWKRLK